MATELKGEYYKRCNISAFMNLRCSGFAYPCSWHVGWRLSGGPSHSIGSRWCPVCSYVNRCQGDAVGALAGALLSCALASVIVFGPSPLSASFWLKDFKLAPFRTLNFHKSQYQSDGRRSLLVEAVGFIPLEAVVSGEQFLLPLVYDRGGLRVFPELGGANAVFIDRHNPRKTGTSTVPGSWDGLRTDPESYYGLVDRVPTRWRRVFSDDGVEVYLAVSP